MRIVFLGTGGYHPNARRHTACILLPELGLAFDAGTSFFRVPDLLLSPHLTILLSHAHLDHISGLTYPLVAMNTGRIQKLDIYGTTGTLAAVQNHLFDEAVFPVKLNCEWKVLPQTVQIGDATITTVPLHHPGGSMGYKLTRGGRSLAYITDTTVNESYLEFIRGVDILIHECNFSDALSEWCEITGHSHTSAVARLAKQANVGRLMLTHIDPQLSGDDPIDLATARKIFPKTDVAEDLLEIDW